VPAGNGSRGAGRRSHCEPYAEQIQAALEKGLSAQRIYQDLVTEHGFEARYDSVKRYVRKLTETQPQRVWRIECPPGEEVQVDFGSGAPVRNEQGRRRRPHVFRIILSYSRKAYSEAVWRQDAETFIRCLENAFRSFGGVPATICPDNLKAAVTKADWFDPELNPKIESFCRHYGTVLLPTRPRTPEHKGKVESGVKYVKNNALKGRVFKSLTEQNALLKQWERTIADGRIHGTTRKQVRKLFEQNEKPALKPLPSSLFPCFQEGRRSVHRDSYVEVAKAYYQVPPEYIGRKVWVRWDQRVVRIYNPRFEQISVLARRPPGTFSSALGPRGRSTTIEYNVAYWIGRAMHMGQACGRWATELIGQRGEQGIRVLQGLLGLSRNHSWRHLDEACKRASDHGAYRLRDIKRLLARPLEQDTFEFMDKHPLIRNLDEYGSFLEALEPQPQPEVLVHE
jgi:transposase